MSTQQCNCACASVAPADDDVQKLVNKLSDTNLDAKVIRRIFRQLMGMALTGISLYSLGRCLVINIGACSFYHPAHTYARSDVSFLGIHVLVRNSSWWRVVVFNPLCRINMQRAGRARDRCRAGATPDRVHCPRWSGPVRGLDTDAHGSHIG